LDVLGAPGSHGTADQTEFGKVAPEMRRWPGPPCAQKRRYQEPDANAFCAAMACQWRLAYHQYADDNGDYLPRRGQGVKPLDQIDRPEDWFNALPPYLNQQFYTDKQKLKAGATRRLCALSPPTLAAIIFSHMA
jgi:hypothetical protein